MGCRGLHAGLNVKRQLDDEPRARPSPALSARGAQRLQRALAGAAVSRQAERGLLALERLARARADHAVGLADVVAARDQQCCSSRRSARDRPGSSVGQAVAKGAPPRSRSDRWAIARA